MSTPTPTCDRCDGALTYVPIGVWGGEPHWEHVSQGDCPIRMVILFPEDFEDYEDESEAS